MIKADLTIRDIETFPETARVWIYQADQQISDAQAARVHDALGIRRSGAHAPHSQRQGGPTGLASA